jgi:putative phage-type endonuclease
MIIHNIEQGSEAWFAARCGRVTGTRFKALVAGEGTATYKDLVTNIVCEIITNKAEETYSNAIMEHGIETEPIARLEYVFLFETEVKTAGFITPDEDHKYFTWIGISPDGLLPEEGILEIKCPLMRTHFEYIEANKLPAEYRYQVQGQLFVTGLKYCDFMSFVDGMKPFIIRVYPDLELFKEFEKRLDLLIIQVQNKLSTYHKYDYINE